MEKIITLTISAVILYLGYLSAVFSSSVLIDPDQIEELAPDLSQSRRDFMRRLDESPAALLQVVTFFKWLSFLAMGALAFSWSDQISSLTGLTESGAFVLVLAAVFMISFTTLEVLPRRRSIKRVDLRLIRLLPVLRIAFAVSSLFVRLQRKVAIRSQEKLSDEAKEEIVERAIESIADQVGASETIVDESEREMIESIFRLDNTLVAEIMSPRVDLVALRLDTPLTKLREIAREHGRSRYPVYDTTIDSIKGVLYIKDIFNQPPKEPSKFAIVDYMREPYYIPENMKIDDLLTAFKSRRVHLAVVVDEHGGTSGIVTLEDILEEIVGDIQDEHDEETSDFVELGDGVYEVDGAFQLEEFSDRLGIRHESESFETVGGLLYDLCGSVPVEGAPLRWGKVTFTVTKLDGQRIERIRATLRPAPNGG